MTVEDKYCLVAILVIQKLSDDMTLKFPLSTVNSEIISGIIIANLLMGTITITKFWNLSSYYCDYNFVALFAIIKTSQKFLHLQ